MFFKHPWPLCFKQSHIFFSWKKIMVHVQLVKHYGKIKKKIHLAQICPELI